MQFPLILARDLPIGAPSLNPEDTILVVRDTGTTERVPAHVLSNISPLYSPTVPATPISDGADCTIAWDDDGVYTYKDGVWGKSPRVTSHWSELDQHSRFLLVNKHVKLSTEELAIARETLDLAPATAEKPGLVRISTDMNANDGSVPTNIQVVDYVNEMLTSLVSTSDSKVNLSNYTGDVLLKGPNGEVLLTYNPTDKTLYLGSKDVNVVVTSQSNTKVNDAAGVTIATIE